MKKRVLAALISVVMTATLLAGCGSSSNDAAEETGGSEETAEDAEAVEDDYVMQIASSTALCGAPIFIAIEQGYLDNYGVNYEFFNSDSSQWDLMAAGKCDYAYGLLPTFVQRVANGFDIDIVMGCHYGCINVVATDASGIESISDLKGRSVGIPSGMGSDPAILLQRMLVAYDVAISDVDLQVYNNTELATALEQGYIEAFVSWDPYATVVSEYEGNHLIFNQAIDEKTKDEICCVAGLRPEFVEEHPEIAENFCKALADACTYIAENPEETAKVIYEKGYVSDSDYEFNGKLLDSYNFEGTYSAAKDSFAKVADDLQALEIISINSTGEELAEKVFVNPANLD